jgi:hypothetical protein
MWDGSLYGQLEASAVLMACVTLCNAQGILDMTPEAISGRTGWPVEFVKKGIVDLEQPDPRSRTPDDDGRRLAKLDDHRDWGWLIVNYEKYRTLADPDTIKDQNKKRAQKYRDRRHAASRCVTPGNGQSRQAEGEAEEGKSVVTLVPGLDRESWNRWQAYRQESGKALKPTSVLAAQRKLAAFGERQAEVVENSIAEGYTGLFPPKPNRHHGKVSEWE